MYASSHLPVTLEVCVDSLVALHAAEKGGADRIELCADLQSGGMTPSSGFMKAARKSTRLPIFAMVRPFPGDFIYGNQEKQAILYDIHALKDLGADGIVGGALTLHGEIDQPFLDEMVAAAWPLPFTFHRAFDLVHNPEHALQRLIEAGVKRLLTSGQAPNAVEGADLIARLVKEAGDILSVMPGSGMTPENIPLIIQKTGVREIHGSFRAPTSVKKTGNTLKGLGLPAMLTTNTGQVSMAKKACTHP
jgi:copper homeostasis protein